MNQIDFAIEALPKTGLQQLLQHFPDMQLMSDRPVEISGGVLRGPKAIWVTTGGG
jgi:hypothetical protein